MKEILTVLFRRKWHALGFFAIAAGLPILMAYILPPRYEARATLLLTPGRYKKPFVPTERDSRTPFMQVSMEDVGSEVEILLSRPVLTEVVERTGLARGCSYERVRTKADLACAASQAVAGFMRATGLRAEVPPEEAAIDRLKRKVSVEFVKRTNVIELTWRGSSPELARDVVNALVDAYLKHHLEVHGNTGALEALDRQAQDDGTRRADAENRLSEFGAKNAISDLEAQHAQLLASLSEAESKVKVLRGLEGHDVSGDAVGALAGDPAFADLSRRLTDAELRRVDVSTRFTPTASQVVLVNKEIAQLKTLIGERVTANLDKWQAMSETYRRELQALDARKNEAARLRRDVEETTERERLSRENLAEVQMSKGLDQAEVASVKVVERAAADRDPAFPKRLLILVVSVFLGLVGAPTWAVAVDRMSGKVLSVEDLERGLGLPVLASVPEYGDGGGGERLASRLRRDLVPVEKALGLDRPSARGACLVTSPSDGAGTSIVAAALAQAAAERLDGPTLLLSVRPTGSGALAEAGAFNGPPEPIVPDALPPGEAAAVPAPGGSTFERRIVAWQRGDGNGSSAGAETMIERARARGARVVVDVPGAQGDPLFLKFLPHVESVVLVAAYDRTGREPLARMAELVRRHGGRIAGCVLNRRRNPIPESIYRRLFW